MTRKGPLRKVISESTQYIQVGSRDVPQNVEHLECGHIQRVPTDMYGEYYAERRRCRQCYRDRAQTLIVRQPAHRSGVTRKD